MVYQLVLFYRFLKKIYFSFFVRDNCVKKNILLSSGLFISRGVNLSFLGESVYIGRHCHIGTHLDIESDVMIASFVAFVGGDHDFSNPDKLMMHSGRGSRRGIKLEKNTWIGHGSTLLDGVTISEGSIVAAGSVVTKTFPPFSIIGGNPAKIIRRRK